MAKIKSIKKQITITVNENNTMSLKRTGLTDIEVLGLLRLYEQVTSIKIIQNKAE